MAIHPGPQGGFGIVGMNHLRLLQRDQPVKGPEKILVGLRPGEIMPGGIDMAGIQTNPLKLIRIPAQADDIPQLFQAAPQLGPGAGGGFQQDLDVRHLRPGQRPIDPLGDPPARRPSPPFPGGSRGEGPGK